MPSRIRPILALALSLTGSSLSLASPTAPAPLPVLRSHDGRHALFVDGAPFLILGGQCGNSSAWPSTLPSVWSAITALHANTLEAPVYWEQLEPEPGHFDFANVDALLEGARSHHVRLVLLWFATWKNGSPHYMPLWMKREPGRYPRMVGRDGRVVDSASPFAPATLEADCRAFAALMRHLREVDATRTVIMVQVENESGTWGSVRDFSPAAQAAFAAPVPATLLRALHLENRTGQTWSKVFGADADETFHAWSVASFIGKVAAAGKSEYPLPMYTNAALRDPLHPPPASAYESGGPTDNMIPVWKAAAPALDLLAPDIYLPGDAPYRRVLSLYGRPDNALFIPETGRSPVFARFVYAALDHGAIGWSPFGIDHPGPPLAPVAANFELLSPAMREFARLSYEGRLHASAEAVETHVEEIPLGRWTAVVSYGAARMFGKAPPPKGNPEPVGGAIIAQLGTDSFLVTGRFCRVDFRLSNPSSPLQREFLRVEEGSYNDGRFVPTRIWNGDETDLGLNFRGGPHLLRVLLGTY